VQTFPANPLIGNGRTIENTPNPRRRAKARKMLSEACWIVGHRFVERITRAI